ncbi:MAG: YlxR family protein [Acidimicrobiales bacterium]|nr:YlxR family protein [Acidimicrobiales bacterium]
MSGEGGRPPQRTCIGCRRVAPASELVRVVRTADGGLVAGRTLPGRGAWLCRPADACLQLAVRRRAFARALRGDVRPGADEVLRAALGGGGDPTTRRASRTAH